MFSLCSNFSPICEPHWISLSISINSISTECEEEEVVTCANCETISEEDLRTPEASDSEPEEDDNLDPDDEDYVVELDELKSMTQEEAQLLNEL